MKQIPLFELQNSFKLFSPRQGMRKSKRPLSKRHPIHITMKSCKSDLRHNRRAIIELFNRFAQQFGVKIYRMVVNSNHIHAVVRIHSAEFYAKFIRSISGTMARCLGVKWLNRPATRLASWGKDFKRLMKYLTLNLWEAEGFIDYQPHRTRRLPHWLVL